MQTVSIAMATFNGERFLQEQLDSLARQSVLPLELVITDDGSTDKTLLIIDNFRAVAPFPVRLYTNEKRLGFRRNFMKCATLCNGDLISFCDQDDLWDHNKIDKMIRTFDYNRDILLVYHNAIFFSSDGDHGTLYTIDHNVSDAFSHPSDIFLFALGFCITFKKSLVKYCYLHSISRDPNNYHALEAHDQWYYFMAHSLGQIYYVSDPLVRYRQHSGNLYGWGRRSPVYKLFSLLPLMSFQQLSCWACSFRRLQTLRLIQSNEGSFYDRIKYSINNYTNVTQLWRDRTALYNRRTLFRRFSALYRLFRHGSYGCNGRRLHFGLGSMAKDLLVGLPLGGYLRAIHMNRIHSS